MMLKCSGSGAAGADTILVQRCAARWCKEGGAGAEMQVQRFHRAQSCRGADKDAEMQRCTDTVVKRCRGGAEEVVQRRWCRGGAEGAGAEVVQQGGEDVQWCRVAQWL